MSYPQRTRSQADLLLFAPLAREQSAQPTPSGYYSTPRYPGHPMHPPHQPSYEYNPPSSTHSCHSCGACTHQCPGCGTVSSYPRAQISGPALPPLQSYNSGLNYPPSSSFSPQGQSTGHLMMGPQYSLSPSNASSTRQDQRAPYAIPDSSLIMSPDSLFGMPTPRETESRSLSMSLFGIPTPRITECRPPSTLARTPSVVSRTPSVQPIDAYVSPQVPRRSQTQSSNSSVFDVDALPGPAYATPASYLSPLSESSHTDMVSSSRPPTRSSRSRRKSNTDPYSTSPEASRSKKGITERASKSKYDFTRDTQATAGNDRHASLDCPRSGPTNHVLVPQEAFIHHFHGGEFQYHTAPDVTFQPVNVPELGVNVGKVLASSESLSIMGGDDAIFKQLPDRVIKIKIRWPGYDFEFGKHLRTNNGTLTRRDLLEALASTLVLFTREAQDYKLERGCEEWEVGIRSDKTRKLLANDFFITKLIHRKGAYWQPEIWIPRSRR